MPTADLKIQIEELSRVLDDAEKRFTVLKQDRKVRAWPACPSRRCLTRSCQRCVLCKMRAVSIAVAVHPQQLVASHNICTHSQALVARNRALYLLVKSLTVLISTTQPLQQQQCFSSSDDSSSASNSSSRAECPLLAWQGHLRQHLKEIQRLGGPQLDMLKATDESAEAMPGWGLVITTWLREEGAEKLLKRFSSLTGRELAEVMRQYTLNGSALLFRCAG